jgi:hypothetical protein
MQAPVWAVELVRVRQRRRFASPGHEALRGDIFRIYPASLPRRSSFEGHYITPNLRCLFFEPQGAGPDGMLRLELRGHQLYGHYYSPIQEAPQSTAEHEMHRAAVEWFPIAEARGEQWMRWVNGFSAESLKRAGYPRSLIHVLFPQHDWLPDGMAAAWAMYDATALHQRVAAEHDRRRNSMPAAQRETATFKRCDIVPGEPPHPLVRKALAADGPAIVSG